MHPKWWIYVSFWLNNLKITNTPIRKLHNILNNVSDWQFTRLNIATSTHFDLLKVCSLFTDTAFLIFLWSKTIKTCLSPDHLYSLFFFRKKCWAILLCFFLFFVGFFRDFFFLENCPPHIYWYWHMIKLK